MKALFHRGVEMKEKLAEEPTRLQQVTIMLPHFRIVSGNRNPGESVDQNLVRGKSNHSRH